MMKRTGTKKRHPWRHLEEPARPGDTIAVEWERRIPGITQQFIEGAKNNSNPDTLKNLLEFLAWQPTTDDRRRLALLKRLRADRAGG
jgi:hypothetical protein